MRQKIVIVLIISLLSGLLAGCAAFQNTGQKQYTATFMTLFDTVTSIVGSAESEDAFRQTAQEIHDELLEYHRLFDIYNEYDGITNLKTINESAGIEPVRVDERIIRLLVNCKEFYTITGGKVNVAMGSVLSLWHEARKEGMDNPKEARLPDRDALKEAAMHVDLDAVQIDEEASTVYISDPHMQLDVGAIAKGWSVGQVAENAPTGLLISVGGNVCVTGPKDKIGSAWIVGIQNPDKEEEYLQTICMTEGSVVTSGDYQRSYMVDGKRYHHIIDPDTLYPADYWRSVTIICSDSGVADALSTALFLMSQEEGQKLLDQYDAEAMWVDTEGVIHYSPGLRKFIRADQGISNE